jgi:hypothetical protein
MTCMITKSSVIANLLIYLDEIACLFLSWIGLAFETSHTGSHVGG